MGFHSVLNEIFLTFLAKFDLKTGAANLVTCYLSQQRKGFFKSPTLQMVVEQNKKSKNTAKIVLLGTANN